MPHKDPAELRECRRAVKSRIRDDPARHEEYKRKAREYSSTPERRAKIAEASRLRNAQSKREAVDAYGGACSCCGESGIAFLAIDHVDNDGSTHRATFGSRSAATGPSLYRWLKRRSWPAGFQVLCANCNWGKHLGGGVCPHQLTVLRLVRG